MNLSRIRMIQAGRDKMKSKSKGGVQLQVHTIPKEKKIGQRQRKVAKNTIKDKYKGREGSGLQPSTAPSVN
jgi:hypothetical protein